MKQRDFAATHGEPLTMTVAEYAKMAGVGEKAVRIKLAAGELPFTKYGRLIRILRQPALSALGRTIDAE